MLLYLLPDRIYSSKIEEFETEMLAPILEMLSIGFFIASGGVFFFYLIRLYTVGGPKKRFDFISKHEISFLWYTVLLSVIGLAVYVDGLAVFVATSVLWFIIKIIIIGLLASIVGVIFYYSLKFYYPFFIERRLKKLRVKPRVNPANGNVMKLLSEEEEDVYLDEGMQAEEDVFSVDYDVWIDEETGFTLIEKYQGNLTANSCPDCNYQTLKIFKEEIITSPTLETEGEIDRYFKCTYCSYKSRKTVKVARIKQAE